MKKLIAVLTLFFAQNAFSYNLGEVRALFNAGMPLNAIADDNLSLYGLCTDSSNLGIGSGHQPDNHPMFWNSFFVAKNLKVPTSGEDFSNYKMFASDSYATKIASDATAVEQFIATKLNTLGGTSQLAYGSTIMDFGWTIFARRNADQVVVKVKYGKYNNTSHADAQGLDMDYYSYYCVYFQNTPVAKP